MPVRHLFNQIPLFASILHYWLVCVDGVFINILLQVVYCIFSKKIIFSLDISTFLTYIFNLHF